MIRQRILYVGIGGSGLDLGIELDRALKREICGLDGNNLTRKGLADSANQLPSFVQQVYVDLAAAAISQVTRNLAGSSVRAITNIIPRINSYADVAESLRLHSRTAVAKWLPDAPGEPQVNPLSAGAGQFPTVGRAALFQSIQDQGLEQSVLLAIREAIADLSSSMGDLHTYTDGNANDGVAVYVGFSVSGGTGSGLFYDILMFLINELKQHMTGSNVVIMPAVLLPSTFSGVLGPVPLKRANLNAASSLVDLSNMIEGMSAVNASNVHRSEVAYPSTGTSVMTLGGINSNVQMPVAAVISSTAGMSRDDTVRMLASAIVTQASLSSGEDAAGNVTNSQTFGEAIVNMQSVITMDPRAVMHKPLMPMVSASLTVPSRKIADIVAKNLLVAGYSNDEGQVELTTDEAKDLGLRILRLCGLNMLVDGERFADSYVLSFEPSAGIRNQKDLGDKIRLLKNKIDTQARPVIRTEIHDRIRQMTTFDIFEGIEKVAGSRGDIPLPHLLVAAQSALSWLETGTDEPVDNAVASVAKPPSRRRIPFIPSKGLQQTEIRRAFEKVKLDFEKEVQQLWLREWANVKQQWRPSVNSGRTRVGDLNLWWSTLKTESNASAERGIASVTATQLGVKDFIPTRGVSESQALKNIYNATRDALMASRRLENQSTFSLVQNILGEMSGDKSALRTAIGVFRSARSRHEFDEVLLEKLRIEVHEVFGSVTPGQPTAFSSLASLLEETLSPTPSQDAIALVAELGNLVPGVLVPGGKFEQGSVVITYPGNYNRDVEAKILELVFTSGAMKQLVGAGPASPGSEIGRLAGVTIQPVGDSDSVTVNINKIGQTLFDNDEVCRVLQAWQDELETPEEEKLAWRQRLGHENLDRVLGGASRSKVLHKLIVGLWGGCIEIETGTNEQPEKLIIRDEFRAISESSLPRIELSLAGFSSGWSGLLSSFEHLLIEIGGADGGFRRDIIEKMLVYVPSDLRTSSSVPIPPVIAAILNERKSRLAMAKEALENPGKYSSQTVTDYRNLISFWTEDFGQAWKLGGTNLHAASLNMMYPLD